MNRENIFRDVCIVLGLTQIDNSWVKTLGAHLGVTQIVGDDYEQRVFVSCFANGTSTNSGSVLIFDTFSDFPSVGEDNTLYVTKDANVIYRWDNILGIYATLNDPDVVNPDAPEEGQTFFVRLATAAALQPVTYNNGTAGVGATLTSTTNIVLSEINTTGRIDQTAPALGNVILVKSQASTLQNGIYEVTQLGTVGVAPFILTRIDGYNETSEVYPSIVFVNAGVNNINKYFTQNTVNPVIGTNGLVYGVAGGSAQTLPVMFTDTYIDDMTTVGARTYTSGTVFPSTIPGFGATIRANANGALGTINGVPMTSGRTILINDSSTPLLNGDYTVTNAGSATQRWQLQRRNYASSGFNHTVREWLISNILSDVYGSRFSIDSTVPIVNANIGITQAINFIKQNDRGLRDVNGDVEITDDSGQAGLQFYGDGTAIIYGINSQLSLDTDIINRSAELSSDIVTIKSNDGNQYMEVYEAIGRVKLEAGDGADIESSLSLTTQGAGEVKIYSTDGSNEASIGVTNAGVINIVSDSGLAMQTNGQMTLNTSVDSIIVTSATIVDITSSNGSIFLGSNNGDIVLTAADPTYFIKLQGLDTYANEAAGIVGGVPTNAIYKTATGELRIKL